MSWAGCSPQYRSDARIRDLRPAQGLHWVQTHHSVAHTRVGALATLAMRANSSGTIRSVTENTNQSSALLRSGSSNSRPDLGDRLNHGLIAGQH